MPLLVSIDVPAETLPTYEVAIAGSCEAALGEGTCTTATASAEWVAIVRWDDVDYRTLRIELRPSPEEAPVESRVVAFTPADPPRQRWASAGLVIAALVARHVTADAASTSVPVPGADEPAAPSQAPLHPWVRVDLGGVLGQGLDTGAPRLGGLLRVGLIPWQLPITFHAGTRWTERGGLPTVRWAEVSSGLAVRLGPWSSSWTAEVRAEGLVEWVRLTAEEPATRQWETAQRRRGGGRLGADLVWVFADPGGAFVSAEATVIRPEILVSIGGEDAGREPPVRFAGSTGIRLDF